MQKRRNWLIIVLLIVLVTLISCRGNPSLEPTPTSIPEVPAPTEVPTITIVDRKVLIVGVDTAYPPFADLDLNGEPFGLEIDLLAKVMENAGIDFQLQSAPWEDLFVELVSGKYDAVIGGITDANAPPELVELTHPYFEIGQLLVVLDTNTEIQSVENLANAVIGVQPLSWGETAITGDNSDLSLAVGSIRRYETADSLIDALFNGYVDAIITHDTVIENYMRVNPGYLRVVKTVHEGNALNVHRFSIAVPRGSNDLLQTLNEAISDMWTGDAATEVLAKWGFLPEFEERPRFVQDPGALSLLAGVEKVDERAVRFMLNRPDPFFDYKMTVPALSMHSAANLEEYGKTGELTMQPVGTGPYLLNAWEPGEAITLTAYPEYWGTVPGVETIVFETEPDANLRFQMLRGNAAQIVDNLSVKDLEYLDDNPIDEIEVYYREPINVSYLGMNRDVAPFDNKSVRMAIATCIDQPQLVEEYYPENSLIATQMVPPNTFGFTPGLLWHAQDSEGASALLATAGYPDGISLRLSVDDTPSDFLPDPHAIAEAIQRQLAECKIDARLEYLDSRSFADRVTTGELDFHLTGWSPDFPGPIGFFNTHFTGRGNARQFGSQFPEIVRLLDQAATLSDITLRRELYDQVNTLLKEKVVFVPIAHGASNLAARDSVKGLVEHPLHRESLANLEPISEPTSLDTLTYLIASDPISLDPTDELDDTTLFVNGQIFETLVKYSPSSTELAPSLAVEWRSNETFDVWEFELREGVRFHDGTPFDADIVVMNFERLWQTDNPYHVGRTGRFQYFSSLFSGFAEP